MDDLSDQQRANLIETIMGVRREENSARSSDDRLSDSEMRSFRQHLVNQFDDTLVTHWYNWVGEWLSSRDRFYDEVDEQFEKTLDGEHDYGFTA